MDDLVKEVIPLLQYLIPGFLTAWIFYSLTAFKRPDTFGQIVQALVFTFVIHGAVAGIGKLLLWAGSKGHVWGVWDKEAVTVWTGVTAVAIGLLSCYLANTDKLHALLRWMGFSTQTSHPSEWYSAFSKHKRFVVLNLLDERRIYGWPLEWPTEPTQGQFVLHEPAWLNDDGTEIPIPAELFVIDASKVEWVEFTPKTWK
ncbi:DUF6338 family protein [Pseudomonas asiatica]|uniref:DUF6338 family protein n=1 Tax=Pseudomonas asiatica TaxID=2219225 RepID=A0A9X4HYK5_9PSED|nr:DUF6338 family protein [Pseudomonas asiatica]MDD2113781.1 DUF6338 family protein [Pseudomonas asiatica]